MPDVRPDGGIIDAELDWVASGFPDGDGLVPMPSVWHFIYGSAVRISFLKAAIVVLDVR